MTVVVTTKGRTRNVSRKSYPFPAGASRRYGNATGIDLLDSFRVASYAGIYKSQPWIHTVVNKLARGIARLPLKSYRLELGVDDSEEPTRIRLRRHPLPALLSRPNPRTSTFQLVEATVGSLGVYGNALLWKYRPGPGQAPVELWPLDWRYVTFESSRDSTYGVYTYAGPEGTKRMLADDVVHVRWWSPVGPAGTSPLEPLRGSLLSEDAAQRYSISSFYNAVRPSGAFMSPKRLTPQQRADLQAEIDDIYAGPDNAFRALLMDGGLDWKTFSHTAQEGELIATRKLNRNEACAVYDIPPSVVHDLDKATFSNIEEQHRMLYEDSYGPAISMIEGTLEAQLIWGEPDFVDTYVEFDLGGVLRANTVERATSYGQFRQAGVYTANELRAKENLPRIDHPAADSILIPLAMTSVGDGGYELAVEEPDVATASLLSDALRTLSGRNGGA